MSSNPYHKPKSQQDLCNLMHDLHITIISEFTAHKEGYEVDAIRMATATMHMLYLVHEETAHVPVLFCKQWIGSDADTNGDRIFQVLNALLLLSNPVSSAPEALRIPWIQTATMVLGELLYYITGAPESYRTYCANVAAIVKLLAFLPTGRNTVFYNMLDTGAPNGSPVTYIYRKRMQ